MLFANGQLGYSARWGRDDAGHEGYVLDRWVGTLVQRSTAWVIVAVTVVVALVCGAVGMTVEQDDDLLAFLPQDSPDIQAFERINERFGGTDVALVGIEAGNVFDHDFLERLDALSDTLRDTPGLDASLTLTNVQDFEEDPSTGGIIQSTLVDTLPSSPEEEAALRDKVLSRDHIVGTLVSADGTAAQVVAMAAYGTSARDVAAAVRAGVLKRFAEDEVVWGGAPFISTWIYNATQADMMVLVPWSIAAIVLIMMIAFRDLVGTALGLVSTGIGIAVSQASMVALGVPFNIVLSSMPVILFAVGSAYAIHILSHYDAWRAEGLSSNDAVAATLKGTGPTVAVAGLTTVAGLLSFVTMDIAPMRTFGAFTALGLFATLVLSLTFVPAVIVLFPRPKKAAMGGPLLPLMQRIAAFASTRRKAAIVLFSVISALGLSAAGAVSTRMDLAAFFDADAPPAQAERFMEAKFGGSQFLQLDVRGNLGEPSALRELQRVSDTSARMDHISDVQGIDEVIRLVTDAMTGSRRIPDNAAQLGGMFRFASSDPSVSRLVTEERDEAGIKGTVAPPGEVDTHERQHGRTCSREPELDAEDHRPHPLRFARVYAASTAAPIPMAT